MRFLHGKGKVIFTSAIFPMKIYSALSEWQASMYLSLPKLDLVFVDISHMMSLCHRLLAVKAGLLLQPSLAKMNCPEAFF